MSGGFNLEPGDRAVIEGVEYVMMGMVVAEHRDDPDDLQLKVIRTGKYVTFTEAEFLALYSGEKIRLLTSTERLTDRPPEDKKVAARACNRLQYVKAFDASPVSKSDKPLRAFIARVAAEIGDPCPPSTGSLRRWTRDRGDPGNRKLREMADRYMPARGSRLHPFVENSLVEEQERYWASSRVTAKEIWMRVVTKIANKNDELLLPTEQAIPTIAHSTVWRRCKEDLTYERACSRLGHKEAARLFKAIKGSLDAKRLLDVAIMDHTIVDCWVVDDVTFQPIGRPRVTFMTDACSRYPLGFHIGWKDASVEAAMACLRHALADKSYVKERFPEIQHKWEAYGQPRTILVDQGLEFSGTSFEDACADLAISIERAPVRTPQYKGQIERFIGTVNTQLFHRLQGSVPGKPAELEKLGIDPETDAILLLSEIDAALHKWIVDNYAREDHRGIDAPPAMVWKTRRKTDPIELCPDLAALNATCSKIVERTLDREGIELNRLTYRSDEVSDLLQDLLPRVPKRHAASGSVRVKVKYHPEDLGQVYVWNSFRAHYVALPCTTPDYARGLGEHLHAKLRKWTTATKRAFSSEVEMSRARVELYDSMKMVAADRVKDRKRLQRLRDPERALIADQVRLNYVDNGSDPAIEHDPDGLVFLIDPVGNRSDGDQLHRRKVLRPAKPKTGRTVRPRGPVVDQVAEQIVADLRPVDSPLADIDWSAMIDAARADAEAS
jgi:putative transposase